MPIYEYVCAACENRFEELVFGDARPACPRCGGAEVRRSLSAFAVGSSSPKASAPPTPCGGPCGEPGGAGSCPYRQ